jgi:hypothetical protein
LGRHPQLPGMPFFRAGGYPEPADIFVEEECFVDQDTEEFILGENAKPLPMNRGLLVRWSEVEYLEFY